MDSMTIFIFFFLSLMMCWLLVVPFPIKGINEVRKVNERLMLLVVDGLFPDFTCEANNHIKVIV